jgi:hypothetical protein
MLLRKLLIGLLITLPLSLMIAFPARAACDPDAPIIRASVSSGGDEQNLSYGLEVFPSLSGDG